MEKLVLDIKVKATIESLWQLLTEASGWERFLAPEIHIDCRIDGLFDVHFFPENPQGLKGAEGMRIMVVEEHERIAHTWNQPPFLSAIKDQRTCVEWRIEPIDESLSRVTLSQTGWGEGAEWLAARKYFEGAWAVVLKRLQFIFESRSIDWNHLPEFLVHRPDIDG